MWLWLSLKAGICGIKYHNLTKRHLLQSWKLKSSKSKLGFAQFLLQVLFLDCRHAIPTQRSSVVSLFSCKVANFIKVDSTLMTPCEPITSHCALSNTTTLMVAMPTFELEKNTNVQQLKVIKIKQKKKITFFNSDDRHWPLDHFLKGSRREGKFYWPEIVLTVYEKPEYYC